MCNSPARSQTDLPTWSQSPPDGAAAAAPSGGADDGQASEWSLVLEPVHHVDQRWLRQANRALVLACVREYRPITRVRIAERTSLSRATVSAITSALLQEGVIREGERLPATTRGGRRAVLLYAMTSRDSSAETQAREQ